MMPTPPPRHPAGYHPDNVRIEIRQVGRWSWAASVTCGMLQWGEFGGPYAMTRKRCIKKAGRAARKMRRKILCDLAREVIS